MLRRNRKRLKDGQSTMEKYSIEQVERALRASGGFRSLAAKKLKCAVATVGKYINKYDALQIVEEEIQESHLDLSESKLISKIKSGNLDAVKFHLDRKGKKRGYVKREELAGVSDAPLSLKIVRATGPKKEEDE